MLERGPKLVANQRHLDLLRRGVGVWNDWRAKEPSISPDLRDADRQEADLNGAALHGADLRGANFFKANLFKADLREANLSLASLQEAHLTMADLRGAYLERANLYRANLYGAKLEGAHLHDAFLNWANLSDAKLTKGDLRKAALVGANLTAADLSHADLTGANLTKAILVDTVFADALLTGCIVYGVSAWNVKLSKDTKQQDLVITHRGEPKITVDNIEVAQFVYLLLHNEKIRGVIDTVTSKVVLILDRFTPERKAVLDAIREELRIRHYVPILFDFDVPAGRDITETVSLLARMARFIIADLTEASSIQKELEAIVPHLAVPVQPLLGEEERPY
jgi:Pentapeptide repeats (8 copies)